MNMLLQDYSKEISRPECRPEAQTLHCIAHLEQDVGCAIPYLNAVLGGSIFIKDPPSVTFRSQGKLITVHARKIAINALHDVAEADRILEWLKTEINNVWERRLEITPLYQAVPQPKIFDILKLLPKTNCGKCGQPTCMVFAALVVEGGKGPGDCPELEGAARDSLCAYLGRFRFEF